MKTWFRALKKLSLWSGTGGSHSSPPIGPVSIHPKSTRMCSHPNPNSPPNAPISSLGGELLGPVLQVETQNGNCQKARSGRFAYNQFPSLKPTNSNWEGGRCMAPSAKKAAFQKGPCTKPDVDRANQKQTHPYGRPLK